MPPSTRLYNGRASVINGGTKNMKSTMLRWCTCSFPACMIVRLGRMRQNINVQQC